MKAKAYHVVNAGHLRSLEAVVTIQIGQGWQPLGGVYSAPKTPTSEPIWKIDMAGTGLTTAQDDAPTSTNWCQAMIKY